MKKILISLVLLALGIGVYMLNDQSSFQGNIVLVGPPGSGKGTLAQTLSEHTNLPVLTVSTVLKQAMQNDPELEKEVKALMDQGKLVSDEVIEAVLSSELKQSKYQHGVIFDGFPRTVQQTLFFANNDLSIDLLIHLEVDDEAIVERMAGRLVHQPSGRMYHVTNNPPKVAGYDDVTGERLSQRADDEPEIVRRRLKDYERLTAPVLDWANQEFKKEGVVKRIATINAMQSIDEVWKDVEILLQDS